MGFERGREAGRKNLRSFNRPAAGVLHWLRVNSNRDATGAVQPRPLSAQGEAAGGRSNSRLRWGRHVGRRSSRAVAVRVATTFVVGCSLLFDVPYAWMAAVEAE